MTLSTSFITSSLEQLMHFHILLISCLSVLEMIKLNIACNTEKGTFGHLRKVSSRISLRYPRRLIRDDTL